MTPPKWEEVVRTVDETVAAMRAMPYEPHHGFKDSWPTMWCEFAAIAIAEVLQARGLGTWTFVFTPPLDDRSGHSWLEYRDDDGRVLYSVDVTLQQFARYGSPYVGPGQTPAAAEFTNVRFEGSWRDWPVVEYTPVFPAFADAAMRQMGFL